MSLTKASYSMINGAPINVKDFGAVGDGVTDDTAAIQAAAAYIETNSGGAVVFPAGTYLVGSGQTFVAGTGIVNAIPVVDNSEGVFAIRNCTKPVTISGEGAVIKWASGTYFGSFNKNTKAPVAYTDPTSTFGYAARMFNFTNCLQVSIEGFELNGNIDTYIIGGFTQVDGLQIPGNGIRAYNNKMFTASDIYAHHQGLDGFTIGWTGLSDNHLNQYPHTLTNCKSTYNARQGLSWVGGNSLTCVTCDFSFTGKNAVLSTAPRSGLDIEPESSVCKNGTFLNCSFNQNDGVGILADTGTTITSNMSFVGCSALAVSGDVGSYWLNFINRGSFVNCTFNGTGVNPQNAVFTSCKFLMDPTLSSNGTLAGTRQVLDGTGATFSDCYFYAASGYTLPFSAAADNVYEGCTFLQAGTGTFFTRGIFTGKNTLTYATGTFDSTGSVYSPETKLNGSVPSVTTSPTYEIGTWTPVLRFGGASVGITYSLFGSSYTKIGRLVTAFFDFQLSSKGSSTGTADITGLPFATSSLGDANASFVTGFVTASPTGGYATSTTINITTYGATGNTVLTDGNFSNTTRLAMKIEYIV